MAVWKWVVGVAVAGAAGLGYAAYSGAQYDRRLSAALQMGGSGSGLTLGGAYELGDLLARDTGIAMGDSRDIVFWTLCSGAFDIYTVKQAAHNSALMLKLGHTSAEEAVRGVIKLTANPAGDPLQACPR